MSKKTSTTNRRHHTLSVMRVKNTVKLGFKSLWNHRLRSLLTTLGIVFGVASVIAMLAIGEGASYETQEMIRRMGSNNIIIRSIKPPDEKKSTTKQTRMVEYGITYADVDRVSETIPSVDVTVPARIIRKDVWHGGFRVVCEMYGTVPWYTRVNNHEVAVGRFFNEVEFTGKANVCVLEPGMAQELFPLDSPIGLRVHVGTKYYHVVGIMQPRAARASQESGDGNGNGAAPADEAGNGDAGASHRMYIPLSTAKERYGEVIYETQSGSRSLERVELHEVTIGVESQDDVVETSLIIEDVLALNHKRKDYEIVVPLSLLRDAERTKQIFNIVLGGIAAISLVVGGIGIMNIMLASVTERTREIGVRRALGAKRKDIVIQFLVETVILSGVGGLIGVALGIAIPLVIEAVTDMRTIVTPWSPIIAFSISALVGVVFGIYPAVRAADMDPVEALRHE